MKNTRNDDVSTQKYRSRTRCRCEILTFLLEAYADAMSQCKAGVPLLDVSMSTSHIVGPGFASRPGHTKDHNKNGTNCLPAWHAMARMH